MICAPKIIYLFISFIYLFFEEKKDFYMYLETAVAYHAFRLLMFFAT